MLELATISLTVFSYVTEENDRVVQAIHNAMAPELVSEKLTKIGTNSQFGDPLVIYSFESDDPEHISSILTHLGTNIQTRSRTYLSENLEKKIDFDERSLYFRLDKYKAYENEIFVTEGSDVIRVEVAYNAYTKKQNSIDNVTELFRSFKLVD